MRPVAADWKRGYVRGKRSAVASVYTVATVGIWMCLGHFIREASSSLVPVCVMGLNGRKGKMGFGEITCSFSDVCLQSAPWLVSEPRAEERFAEVRGAILTRSLCDIWGQMMRIFCTENGEEGLVFHQGLIWG